MFGRFLGTKKPVEVKEDKPIDMTRMNEHMSTLDKREEMIQKKIDGIDAELAKLKQEMAKRGSNYSTLRSKASALLTRKKMYSNQLRSVQGMNMTMGQTAMTIENMQMMKDQYNIMKEVSDAQSQMFKTVNMNEFLSLSDKMQDMREDMDDVQEMMMDGMACDTEMDEDELDRELAEISMNPVPSAAENIPAQPTAQPAQPTAATPAQDMGFNMNDLNSL